MFRSKTVGYVKHTPEGGLMIISVPRNTVAPPGWERIRTPLLQRLRARWI